MTNRRLSSLRMTKSLLILVFAFCGLTATKTTQAQDIRNKFLVDKIYYVPYSNDIATEYIYDDENKLIKIGSGYSLEYENGRVSKILKHNALEPQYDHDIHLFYNEQGQLIRRETWMNGGRLGVWNFHYEDERMVSIYDDNTMPFETNTLVYDNLGNVIKHIYIVPKLNDWGQPIPGEFEEREYNYEYDNNPQPNFGVDYVFPFDFLPVGGTETGWARGLSQNNLIKYVNSGTTYTFTYNENGLPETYEVKWAGIETLEPMLWRITYKQIGETSISEVTQENTKINIYPNPTKDIFVIECENFSTITIYDMLGKEVLNQIGNGKSEINVSHLPKGIYNVRVVSEDKIIGNSKIMKQ